MHQVLSGNDKPQGKRSNRKLEDQISPEDLNENVTRLTPQTPFFHRLPRPKIGKNRKPPSLVKPQYRTKKNGLPHLHKPLRPPPIVEIAENVGYISCLILCNGTLGVRGYFFLRLAKSPVAAWVLGSFSMPDGNRNDSATN